MKSIIITGASSGIGRAVAELFLDEGWQVGLLARREEALKEVAKGRTHAVAVSYTHLTLPTIYSV